MFEEALAHEEGVTARIHEMASLALELKDHATYNFLQWFIAEQVEEEETAMDMVQKFKMAGEHPAGLYQLDKELATRVYNAPAPLVALDAATAPDGAAGRASCPRRASPAGPRGAGPSSRQGFVRPPDLGEHLERRRKPAAA